MKNIAITEFLVNLTQKNKDLLRRTHFLNLFNKYILNFILHLLDLKSVFLNN